MRDEPRLPTEPSLLSRHPDTFVPVASTIIKKLPQVLPGKPAPSPSPFGALFSSYDVDAPYDEMFELTGRPRPHCQALFEDLRVASHTELGQRQKEADKAFLTQGITFTVYGDDEGTERIFPFDLLPRIITASEWRTLERGLTQRLTAINLFLKDVYHEGRILAEGVVPRSLGGFYCAQVHAAAYQSYIMYPIESALPA